MENRPPEADEPTAPGAGSARLWLGVWLILVLVDLLDTVVDTATLARTTSRLALRFLAGHFAAVRFGRVPRAVNHQQECTLGAREIGSLHPGQMSPCPVINR